MVLVGVCVAVRVEVLVSLTDVDELQEYKADELILVVPETEEDHDPQDDGDTETLNEGIVVGVKDGFEDAEIL